MRHSLFKMFTVTSALVMQLMSSTVLNVRAIDYNNETAKVEVINLSSTISETDIERIKESVNAKLVLEDKSEIPLDTVITIEDVSVNNHMSETDAKSYRVNVCASVDTEKPTGDRSQKVVSDNSSMNTGSVNAIAFLILVWTDGSGWNNYIDEVECSRSVTSGTISSATLRYGNGYQSSASWTSVDVKSYSSYTAYPNMVASRPTADYTITFQESAVALCVDVYASIFQ